MQAALDQEQQKRKSLTAELLAVQAEASSLRMAKDIHEKEINDLKNYLSTTRQDLIQLRAVKSVEEAQVLYL